MIEIRGLYKRYLNHRASAWVLKDINLTIPRGVSVGLLGRNGAGKSTLLRLIAGMDAPNRGEIQRRCRVSWPIGLSGGLQGSMTGRQNVKFVARVHGGRQNEEGIIRRVQEFAEIGKAFDRPVRTYSSGMRSRLNFGLSLAFDFDVYLSDEATSTGDRGFKQKATKAFKERVGQASLIMVSHSEGILKDLCQAGVYLKNGQATWYDDINDAIAAYHEETGGPAKPSPAPNAAKAADKPSSEPTLPEGLAQLRQCKAKFDTAKAELEQSRGTDAPAQEISSREEAVRVAREHLYTARRQVQLLQPTPDDD
ncbi:ABC transporter ATP-binding protein [Halomonas sp. EGI 63088]|uniref:ABC transporter ATP-binding protein n=1 Tax=Halomonas flagellata TaxID=2920385 RepID=A0ABS9RZ01_9GAMM|nr:ABC transporter ATP-binding protein [Halomonas flagellata]MCH4565044.1 ABC transporter ATP-binding protein [Halomonas flagellata]